MPSGFRGGWPNDELDRTFPSSGEVARRLNRIERYIDKTTRTSWTSAGRTVTNEFHDFNYWRYRPTRWRSFLEEGSVHLRFFPIRALSSAAGDKVEVFTAQTANDGYEDFLTTKTQGRNDDFWVDTNEGIIHFANSRPQRLRDAVRITYRYGETSVPEDIERATILLTARDIVSTEDYSPIIAEAGDRFSFKDKATEWQKEAEEILEYHRRLIFESD